MEWQKTPRIRFVSWQKISVYGLCYGKKLRVLKFVGELWFRDLVADFRSGFGKVPKGSVYEYEATKKWTFDSWGFVLEHFSIILTLIIFTFEIKVVYLSIINRVSYDAHKTKKYESK